MKAVGTYRDVDFMEGQPARDARAGRAYIAVIGIDCYRTWNRLYNAVSDANGALKLFFDLGFELVARPLFNESATGDALRQLVVDDLSGLSGDDSLVLFFAGHGHTVTRTYDGATVRDGYLIPADGDELGGRAATWIRLDSWLTEIARIPAKHILVILDACHSGLALGPVLQWRSRGMEHARREPLEQLRARRSRRIITSALDDQRAMDGGPVPGHSLFTGCLIEAMTGGLIHSTGHQIVTGSEIGHYVQRRVSEYPGSMQTPDFGALELDDRGELVVQLPGADSAQSTGSTGLAAARLGDSRESPPHTRKRSRHRQRLWIGGGVVVVLAAGAAALLATGDSPGVEHVTPAFVEPSDSRLRSSAPLDAALAVTTPDAGQPDSSDAAAESVPTKTDRKTLQPSGRRREDANAPGFTRPAIDDRGN